MAVNIFKKAGRQTVLVAETVLKYDELLSPTDLNAVDTPFMDMPQGAIVLGCQVIVETVFDTAGADDVLDVGDNDDPDRYHDGVDLTAAIRYLADMNDAVDVHTYDAGETMNFTWVASGADAAQGQVRIVVEYIIVDRANETQSLRVTNYGAARR